MALFDQGGRMTLWKKLWPKPFLVKINAKLLPCKKEEQKVVLIL
jgi:hypothetical protein